LSFKRRIGCPISNSSIIPKNATATIPVVFTSVGDPVAAGLVASLARLGGNVTGISNIAHELTPKRLELLSELAPQARVIALLVNPTNTTDEGLAREAREAARTKGLQLHILKASRESEIDAAFASRVELRAGALLIGPDAFFTAREQLMALAARHAVLAIYPWREDPIAGGLLSYGASNTGLVRQAGIFLKGEKPADLPVQQPSKFELVINLKTAKALGLSVPQSMLQRADEVIE
jgi:putative ABC transport system substrate-binding protein